MKITQILLLLLFFIISGCAGYKTKKACKKTNWFLHGQKVALEGKRSNEDDFLLSCERAHGFINHAELDTGFKSGMSKYCSIKLPNDYAKEGKNYNFQFCDDGKSTARKQSFNDGLKVFCVQSKGKEKAAKGWIYNNICPAELESTFLVGYKEGRKIYLKQLIEQKYASILEMDKKINYIKSDSDQTALQIAGFQKQFSLVKAKKTDIKTGIITETQERVETYESKKRWQKLNHTIENNKTKINNLHNKQSKLKKEIYTLKQELSGL